MTEEASIENMLGGELKTTQHNYFHCTCLILCNIKGAPLLMHSPAKLKICIATVVYKQYIKTWWHF